MSAGSSTLKNIVADLNREVIVTVLSQIVSARSILDQEWQLRLSHTMIGYLIYYQLVRQKIRNLSLPREIKDLFDDLALTLTILIISHILSGKGFSLAWLTETIYVCVGVMLYHLVLILMRSYDREPALWFQDALETSVITSISLHMSQGSLTSFEWIPYAFITLASVLIYHQLVGPALGLPKFKE